MPEVFIVEAVRSPLGRRGGGLSTLHAADLLGNVVKTAVARAGVEAREVGQVIGGCVSQVGEQSFNVARTAWLVGGTPARGRRDHGRQPVRLVSSRRHARGRPGRLGLEDVVLVVRRRDDEPRAARRELLRQEARPPGAEDVLRDTTPSTSQFQGAELIAKEYGITREDTDRFGLRSQENAARRGAKAASTARSLPIDAPVLDAEGKPTGETLRVARDEGLRETSLEKLAALKPVVEGGLHTAGTSLAGHGRRLRGAARLAEARVKRLGLTPRARVVYTTIVGVDPVTMLKGPIPATRKLLGRTGLRIDDMDVYEVNEAFASVVLAWQKECKPVPERVNPNGGAIALGHPTGCDGRPPDHHRAPRARAHAAAATA